MNLSNYKEIAIAKVGKSRSLYTNIMHGRACGNVCKAFHALRVFKMHLTVELCAQSFNVPLDFELIL